MSSLQSCLSLSIIVSLCLSAVARSDAIIANGEAVGPLGKLVHKTSFKINCCLAFFTYKLKG